MLRMKLVCDILPLMLPPQLLNVLAAFRTGATAALRTK